LLFFPIYAVFVWWGALRFRRDLAGVVWVLILGAGVPLALIWAHAAVERMVGSDWIRIEFQLILYAYAVALSVVGLFIVAMPKRPAKDIDVHRPCTGCGYELASLDRYAEIVCPECGAANQPRQKQSPVAEAQREKFSRPPLSPGAGSYERPSSSAQGAPADPE